MSGRPPLKIGHHGKVKRIKVDTSQWLARCRYRDDDGVVRLVERKGPAGDKHGKLAEERLLEALSERTAVGQAFVDTLVIDLVNRHIDRLEEDGRAARTVDTYRDVSARLAKTLAGVRVREATPPRLDTALRTMRSRHGPTMAKQSKTLLTGGLQLAVLAGALSSNPVRDVSSISLGDVKGAPAITAEQLRAFITDISVNSYCIERDLVDPFILLAATGVRISELLGFLWSDDLGTEITMTGKVVRSKGHGLVRVESAKSKAGLRTIPLPRFAIDVLAGRRDREYYGEQKMIFPSTAGSWRDPDNFRKQWREIRGKFGLEEVTPHSFRKTVATLIDDAGLSARVGADQLGHAQVSMTQDRYMARGRVHHEVADLLDKTVEGQ